MTDITELAQLRAELLSPAIGSKAHLRKIALSLVEALEKASSVSRNSSLICLNGQTASTMVLPTTT
ncbi:TPA: hypothetical protein ACN7N4_002615 [Klebsiella pneumoniae]|jgi:hypothetical protein|uniref:hypothetical protein n=1 Tax=Klebsiella pneumoniae TaxID=573 RepID=UPI00204DD496|nr:hypothetical protein [Klebsiella pneumoniae]DAF02343.1 MAG TPA: hypothetical protein [Caudoviricetes sp.]MCM6150127.1 hypothetical protein [Klebsiella pneumoniae]MCY0507832.1 hypothetical protein [Klebsiella pneumoniae]MDG0356701.1 hypothetical protein [Klebsiella pneumoniae]GKL41222.1 hypothetical protein NUBL21992_21020 [Klebsiella pneumoniae]